MDTYMIPSKCQYKESIIIYGTVNCIECENTANYHVVFEYKDTSLYAMLWLLGHPFESLGEQELNVCMEHREEMLNTNWSLMEEIR